MVKVLVTYGELVLLTRRVNITREQNLLNLAMRNILLFSARVVRNGRKELRLSYMVTLTLTRTRKRLALSLMVERERRIP